MDGEMKKKIYQWEQKSLGKGYTIGKNYNYKQGEV